MRPQAQDIAVPPFPPALPAPEPTAAAASASASKAGSEPVVRYPGARRPSEERERERGDHGGVAYREPSSPPPPPVDHDSQPHS